MGLQKSKHVYAGFEMSKQIFSTGLEVAHNKLAVWLNVLWNYHVWYVSLKKDLANVTSGKVSGPIESTWQNCDTLLLPLIAPVHVE